MQTEEESLTISDHILDILKDGNFAYKLMGKGDPVVDIIVNDIYKELDNLKGWWKNNDH